MSVVAAEALHVVILDALFTAPASSAMTFQGGTCIHLVHGGYRFSEDLDFAGQTLDFVAASKLLQQARPAVERMAVAVLGPGDHRWKEPKQRGRVQSWRYAFTPAGTQQTVRVKVELAQFPVYKPAPLAVRSELDLLQRAPLVNALQPAELLAEKLTAVLGRPYLKGRDLFDLWYLGQVSRGAR